MSVRQTRCCLFWALTAFFPILTIYVIRHYHVDAPYGDEWYIVEMFDRFLSAKMPAQELWSAHSEHRILFPRLIWLAMMRFNSWNHWHDRLLNFALSVGAFLIICREVTKKNKFSGSSQDLWIFPVISSIFFSLRQFWNWSWGFQTEVFLSQLTALAALSILASKDVCWPAFFWAILCGFISIYSFASGLALWPLGMLMILFMPSSDRRAKMLRLLVWFLASLAALVPYLATYQHPLRKAPLLYHFKDFLILLKYVLAFLGAPLLSVDVPYFKLYCAVISLAGLGIFTAALLILIFLRVPREWYAGYVSFGLFSIGSAIMAAVARAGNLNKPIALRYMTHASLFWVSLVLMIYVCIQSNPKRPVFSLAKCLQNKLASFIIILIMIVNLLTFPDSIRHIGELRDGKARGRQAMIDFAAGRPFDEGALLFLNIHSTERVKQGAKILQKNKLSLFREKG